MPYGLQNDQSLSGALFPFIHNYVVWQKVSSYCCIESCCSTRQQSIEIRHNGVATAEMTTFNKIQGLSDKIQLKLEFPFFWFVEI